MAGREHGALGSVCTVGARSLGAVSWGEQQAEIPREPGCLLSRSSNSLQLVFSCIHIPTVL